MIKKGSILAIFSLLLLGNAGAQFQTNVYPKVLQCPNDSFYMIYPAAPQYNKGYLVSRDGNGNFNTDADPLYKWMLCTQADTIVFEYTNRLPYGQALYVALESPKGRRLMLLRYYNTPSYMEEAYIQSRLGRHLYEIPEVYELANIIWHLSPSGRKAYDLYKEGAYHEEVMRYFKPWEKHPVFQQLDFADSVYFDRYYDFRENSLAFQFTDKNAANVKLHYKGPFYAVYGNGLADSSLFGKLRPLVEDFAKKSQFRLFYGKHLAYYNGLITRQSALMPVKGMYEWFAKEFNKNRVVAGRVVFSPLIKGTHSTQQYSAMMKDEKIFEEEVMFVAGPQLRDADTLLSETQRMGLQMGMVFTEIDHNYVNPVSRRYVEQIDKYFGNEAKWVVRNHSNAGYKTPEQVFNEYMTHALFSLYVLDVFDKKTSLYLIEQREKLMVERRWFPAFGAFNQALITMRKRNPQKKSEDLYPDILAWCADYIKQ
jgi:hypothetical protein